MHDVSDAITMQDLEGHIVAWNPSAESMFGWSEAEALTMNINSLVPEERRKEELDILKNLSNAESWNLITPRGSPRTVGSWRFG